VLGKVIDVEFPLTDRGRWCVRCDEPFPEGTALCPRCGGDLASASEHRDRMQAEARKAARRIVAAGAGLLLLFAALVTWLLVGGVAHGDEKAPRKPRLVDKQHPPDGGAPFDGGIADPSTPRPVRVRLSDGSTVFGTVHAEEPAAIVIDCSLGQLSIPRARISTIAYDAAATVANKRAPVQQLDDEDKPTPPSTRKRSERP
jgi:hypothetical protein